ncbi:MBOAT family O-acyltransferase [Cellulosilyticum lentocellum]|uniref:Membrane bound O-acyl transferase MBOAT family protein n=1 Tax=Cellulosilyticum lentocellum (strain ATCC 49066 / DSM 5427 / NCIMB 11756 / RHM5) TaxID=642492 RepID=F2JRC4_CELLD|nr:membrane bound O-acyl transferase MBOAT family protein [Cellulosilyticum lentocellum DSM 5427]
MVFSSLLFLFIFLPVFLTVYFILPKNLRNLILFLASLMFYAWGEPVYVSIMIFSTVLDYTCGRIIDHFRAHKLIPKLGLGLSLIGNLGMLGFFKYADFFISNTNALLGTHWDLLRIALPIGISFYTFQTMSYTIDLYRGKIQVQKNIIAFGAYVSMFPQLIAGPIVTYATVEKELNHREVTFEDFGLGAMRFIEGLGKKVLIANNIGLLWDQILNTPINNLSIIGAWLGAISFGLQLYFDFSGYSDMAIGLGQMLGFRFPENFNYPYIAKSVSDFWRRWHMTLTGWFREYVYIPLGGNRVSKPRFYLNILIVWFLTGFWHGAGWNFILWGLFFAVLMIIERSFLLKYLEKLPSFISRFYLLFVVTISWVLFAHDSLEQAISYLKVMFGIGTNSFINTPSLYAITNFYVLIIIGIVFATPLMNNLKARLNEWVVFAFYVVTLFLSTAYLVDATFNPFLYFRF